MAISYKRDTDYQKKINQAAAIGDNTAAAVYEAQRNAKIQGEGLTGVSQTNRYADYLPDESVIRSIAEQSPGIAGTAQKTKTYQNPYQKQLDQLVSDYLVSSFSYDQSRDPAAQAYRENYIQNGQRAMQDTMAQAAARTGGLASSYATQAGQQAYNSYMSDLNAQLAGLRQQAIDNYLSDQALQQDRINTVASLGQQAESSYYNRLCRRYGGGDLGRGRWNAHHGPELPDLAAELPAGPAGSGCGRCEPGVCKRSGGPDVAAWFDAGGGHPSDGGDLRG